MMSTTGDMETFLFEITKARTISAENMRLYRDSLGIFKSDLFLATIELRRIAQDMLEHHASSALSYVNLQFRKRFWLA